MPRKKKPQPEFPAQSQPRPLEEILESHPAIKAASELPTLRDLGPPEVPLEPLPRSLPEPTGEQTIPEADMGWAGRIRPYHHNRRGMLKGEADAIFLKTGDGLTEEQAESLGGAGFRLTEDQQYWVAPATAARRLIADKVARELSGEAVDYYAGVR